ncbi:MAG: MBL fold metallo-hydrolase [Puniceicoccales bacterium]|nr:MBL fold metallo-hydrolase [Puniceicoccales bacterium]
MITGCHFLGSSSQGNCLLVRSTEGNFLIDAGLTGKQIVDRLFNLGFGINDIDAIFITHEHADHCQGLRGLGKWDHLRFFANEATATAIDDKLGKQFHWNYFRSGESFYYKSLFVETFLIPHDAVEPIGYLLRSENGGKSLCWMTDLGYIPPQLQRYAKDSEILILESNYDHTLLESDRRPQAIKNRIRGRYGHLSNESAFNLITNADRPQWQKIFLAHLSRDCNHPEIITALLGEKVCRRFNITVVNPNHAVGVSYSCC